MDRRTSIKWVLGAAAALPITDLSIGAAPAPQEPAVGSKGYGTDPDIEIDNAPQDYARGADPQLDKAIEVALDVLAHHPPHRPHPTERPHRAAPGLAPRARVGAQGPGVSAASPTGAREPAGAPSRHVEGSARGGASRGQWQGERLRISTG